jgi:hypothetical protein
MATLSPITVARFWSKVSVPKSVDECWTWQGALAGSGYGSFYVPELGGVSVSSHRIAYGLVKDRWPGPDELVRHKCDNPKCVNPHHLELGDHIDNARDMMERGRLVLHNQAGENNGGARLTAQNVSEIRVMFEAGMTNIAIAARFGVHHATVSAIRRGKTWAA